MDIVKHIRLPILMCSFLCTAFSLFAQENARPTFQLSYGVGALILSPQKFSYTSYLPQRPSYEVIPPKQYKVFFPLSLNLRASLLKRESAKMGLGLSIPINIAAFISTDPNRNKFLVLQVPTLLTLDWGERAFPKLFTENGWGAYVGVGGAFTRLTGTGYANFSNV